MPERHWTVSKQQSRPEQWPKGPNQGAVSPLCTIRYCVEQAECNFRPVVDHVQTYEDWLLQCFIIGVPKVSWKLSGTLSAFFFSCWASRSNANSSFRSDHSFRCANIRKKNCSKRWSGLSLLRTRCSHDMFCLSWLFVLFSKTTKRWLARFGSRPLGFHSVSVQ